MKPFQKFVRLAVVLLVLLIAISAFAQAAPPAAPVSIWSLAGLTALLPKFVAIGTALSTFLAVVVAAFPQLTWLSKFATLLGYLPVLDVHGLTTGRMQERMKAAVEAAKLSAKVAPNAAS